MATEKNDFCYIRPSYDATASMEGYAKFQGLDCVFLIHLDKSVTINKLTADNVPYKINLFAGKLEASESENESAPVAVAVVKDKKLNSYRLAFWEQNGDDPEDIYYVCRWTKIKTRKGTFIRP